MKQRGEEGEAKRVDEDGRNGRWEKDEGYWRRGLFITKKKKMKRIMNKTRNKRELEYVQFVHNTDDNTEKDLLAFAFDGQFLDALLGQHTQ